MCVTEGRLLCAGCILQGVDSRGERMSAEPSGAHQGQLPTRAGRRLALSIHWDV